MKPMTTLIILLASLAMLVSCSSIHATDDNLNRDAISHFLARESLTLRDCRVSTNESGYEFNLKLTDKTDSNRVFQGWMMLTDLEKEKRDAERRSIMTKEEERRAREEFEKGTNQFIYLCIINNHDRGIITDARILNSARIKHRFPDYHISCVKCLGLSGNPIYIAQPMVVGTHYNPTAQSTVYILGNAATVASFISMHKEPVRNRDEARDTLNLLSELQSWTICEKAPNNALNQEDAKNPKWLSRWTYRETKTPMGWHFQAVFLTDPGVQSYTYYEIDVHGDGTIIVKDMVHMGNFAGHYQ